MDNQAGEAKTLIITDERLSRYQHAVDRGLAWLLGRLQADGSFSVRQHNLRCYLKSPLALLLAGAPRMAYLVLDSMKRYLRPDGDFKTSPAVKYAADRFNLAGEKNYYLYGNGWATISAHLNGRFDISYPALAYLLRHQDLKTGGFPSAPGAVGEPNQRQDVASTASCGYALLCCGRLSEAAKAADFFVRLAELQPQSSRFYLSLTPAGGPVEGFSPEVAFLHVVDQREKRQAYWMLGYAAALLVKVYLACGEQKYLEGAVRYFDFLRACQPDFTSSFGCWKVAWAAALLGRTVGSEEYARCAAEVLDYIASAQEEDGCWAWGREVGMGSENDDWLVDLSAEMIVWLVEAPRILLSRGVEGDQRGPGN